MTCMYLEHIMVSEMSDREKHMLWYYLHVKSKKYNKLVNATKKKQTHWYREQHSSSQW